MTKKKQFCPKGHDAWHFGRDRSGRCLECKREVAEARDRAIATEEAERDAEWQRRRDEFDRRLEREYRAAIKRGGHDAAMARWDRAFSESLEKTGHGLCQWEDEGPGGEYLGRMCYRRTDDVYCWRHMRQSDRQIERDRREREVAP